MSAWQQQVGEINRWGYPVDRIGLDAWSLSLKREREEKEKKLAAQKRPPLREQEVVIAGHEIELETMDKRSTVGKIAHLAHAHGWKVKVGSATFRTADRWQNDAVVEGVEIEHKWTDGVSPDGQHHFSVSKEIILLDGWPIGNTLGAKKVDELKVHIVEYGTEG